MLQLLEGQFGVKAHAKAVNILVEFACDGETRRAKLLPKGARAEGVNFLVVLFLQIKRRRIGGGQKIIRRCRNAEFFQFFDVLLHAL